MQAQCQQCGDKVSVLDGYPRAEQWLEEFWAQHSTGAIQVEVASDGSRPALHLGCLAESKGFKLLLHRLGVHAPSVRWEGSTVRIPRSIKGDSRGWLTLCQKLADTFGRQVQITQQYRVDPDSAVCHPSCRDGHPAGVLECVCVCGGAHHSSTFQGAGLGHFYLAVGQVEVFPERGVRVVTILPNGGVVT